MQYKQVRNLALDLMKKNNLVGWIIKFNNAKRACGICLYDKKIISFSRYYVLLNNYEDIKNTILHEIAHALSPFGSHHNKIWKRKAMEIGCKAERINHNAIMPEGKYKYYCKRCGEKTGTHRKLKGPRACKLCCIKYNSGHYTDMFKLTLKEENHEFIPTC